MRVLTISWKDKGSYIFYVDVLCCFMKQTSSLFVIVNQWIHSQSTYLILWTTYMFLNNFLFVQVTVAVIENIYTILKVGKWEMNLRI